MHRAPRRGAATSCPISRPDKIRERLRFRQLPEKPQGSHPEQVVQQPAPWPRAGHPAAERLRVDRPVLHHPAEDRVAAQRRERLAGHVGREPGDPAAPDRNPLGMAAGQAGRRLRAISSSAPIDLRLLAAHHLRHPALVRRPAAPARSAPSAPSNGTGASARANSSAPAGQDKYGASHQPCRLPTIRPSAPATRRLAAMGRLPAAAPPSNAPGATLRMPPAVSRRSSTRASAASGTHESCVVPQSTAIMVACRGT